jgi:hypothetical protein
MKTLYLLVNKQVDLSAFNCKFVTIKLLSIDDKNNLF